MKTDETSTALVAAQDNAIGWLTPSNIEAGLRLADTMAKAKLVPDHLRGSPGDCLLVIAQACSWRLNPISVAQSTAVVCGKLCYEGKLVAAVLTSLGAIEWRLSYEFSGKGEDMTVTVTGTPRRGKPVSITGSVKQWATTNENWKKDPQSMLVYRGTRQWARLYAPEAMLGVMTPDEIEHADMDEGAIPAQARRVTVDPASPASPTTTEEPPAKPKPAPAPKNSNGNGKTAHPGIQAGMALFHALPPDHQSSVLARLCATFGCKNTKEFNDNQAEKFGQMATGLLAVFKDSGIEATLENLEAMEAEAAFARQEGQS